MARAILSKSTFIRGLQCHKSLYLYKHNYELKDETPPGLEFIFKQGTQVGLLAQQLFANGVDASPPDHFRMHESVEKTKALIDSGNKIIYEATFQFDGVIAALDILVLNDDGWQAYEVKSSTKVSDTYLWDASIQYYTIINSGIDLKDISIVHINNRYIKKGAININELFTKQSVLSEVQSLIPEIPSLIEEQKNIIQGDEVPEIDIGPHCSDPYDCDFKGYCWSHLPEYSVFDIANLRTTRKFELYSKGIFTLDQIDLELYSFNSNQEIQIRGEQDQKTVIEKNKIQQFLNELNYPLRFLDFETIGPAVPIYDNSKPYQQLPFQYSLHIQINKSKEVTNFEFLAEPSLSVDPRIGFIENLIKDCDESGDILVYNIAFERGKLQQLIEAFPHHEIELNKIISRLKDLMIPFQQKWFYTPEMKGSYSIKYVLPALVPELSYDNLDIKEGGTASNTFLQMITGDFQGDYEKTRSDLIAYCRLDTFAMVKILDKLYEVVS